MSTLHYKDSNGTVRHISPEDRRRSDRRVTAQHYQDMALFVETVASLRHLQTSTAPTGKWTDQLVYQFVTAMLTKIDGEQ